MSEYTVGLISDVPKGEGRNFLVDGERVAIFHTQVGEIFATQPECPHRQGPLADGLMDEATIICPLHDRVFDLRSGQELGADCRLRTYRVRVDDAGCIKLTLSEMAVPA